MQIMTCRNNSCWEISIGLGPTDRVTWGPQDGERAPSPRGMWCTVDVRTSGGQIIQRLVGLLRQGTGSRWLPLRTDDAVKENEKGIMTSYMGGPHHQRGRTASEPRQQRDRGGGDVSGLPESPGSLTACRVTSPCPVAGKLSRPPPSLC